MAKQSTSAETITLAFLCAAEARSIFQMSLPTLSELQHARKAYDVPTLRQSEMTAIVMSMTVAGAVSIIAKDKLPMIVTGLTCLTMLSAYESGIKRPGTPFDEWGAYNVGG